MYQYALYQYVMCQYALCQYALCLYVMCQYVMCQYVMCQYVILTYSNSIFLQTMTMMNCCLSLLIELWPEKLPVKWKKMQHLQGNCRYKLHVINQNDKSATQ